MTETYGGVKDMGNRVAESVYNNRVVKTVSDSYSKFLSVSEQTLDKYLPPQGVLRCLAKFACVMCTAVSAGVFNTSHAFVGYALRMSKRFLRCAVGVN